MEVLEAVEKRRSIRKYTGAPVPPELLNRLLEAARLAPSTSNTQSWKFKVVTDPEHLSELREASFGQKFVERAGVVIACCIDFQAFEERGRRMLELVFKGGVRPSLEMMLRSVRGGKDGEFDPERTLINGVVNVSIADRTHSARRDGSRARHVLGPGFRGRKGGADNRRAGRGEGPFPSNCRLPGRGARSQAPPPPRRDTPLDGVRSCTCVFRRSSIIA